jgi:hypothetical protein
LLTQEKDVSNRNLIENGRVDLLQVVKPVSYALLLSAMVLSTTQLYAQHSSNGPGPQNRGEDSGQQEIPDGGNKYEVENLAYYGDWDSNRVFIIDVDEMTLLETVEGTGDGPYGVDQQDETKAYVLTRKTKSLTIIDNWTITNEGVIPLDHKPRSTNYNADTGLSLVSGADKVMTSIIDVETDTVEDVIDSDSSISPHDFGGSLETGHPLWVDNERFFMLDRAERKIQLWNRDGTWLSEINTPTSVHHIFRAPSGGLDYIYYAVVEGNQGELVSPSILRFKILRGELVVTAEAVLSDYDSELDPAVMGSHHATFHPDGVHIYIGSAEGHVFVVHKNSMKIVTMIDTGKGSGHVTFAPMHNLAFVTNHNDMYMTVINTTDHSLKTNIQVASSESPGYKSQAHTSGISPDMRYFYSAASHDGVFFRIDMEAETLEVSDDDTLDLGDYVDGTPNILMGSFIWNGEGDGM